LRHVDQHHIAVDARREPSELVRPLVERPTRLQVESRVVPVAREDPVADRSACSGEAHVRAPVVDGVHVVAVGEEADDVMVVMDHEPPAARSSTSDATGTKRSAATSVTAMLAR
jgi:hypothetical protein